MSNTLRIVQLGRALETGGLEMLMLDMCLRMNMKGHVASVCTLLPGDGLESRPEYSEIGVATLTDRERRNKVSTVRAIAKILKRERADVVHIHNFLSQVHGAMAARLAGVSVVVTTKHGWEWPSLLGSRAAAGLVWRLADVLVTVSKEMRDGFIAAYNFPPEKTRHILNGIDTDRFCPFEGDRESERRRVLGLSGRPLVGTVCRLVEYKGISTLLQAFAGLRRRFPDAVLVIVGDGADRSKFQQQAVQLGIAPHVHFLGMRNDVAAIYPLLDMFVLPSHTEGISLTLLEAASCALPIVATTVGGNPEIIADGRTGRLVPPHDADALETAIVRLWEDAKEARTMGRLARERTVREFSLDRMADDYLRLYQKTYEAKTRAAGRKARRRTINVA